MGKVTFQRSYSILVNILRKTATCYSSSENTSEQRSNKVKNYKQLSKEQVSVQTQFNLIILYEVSVKPSPLGL